MQKRGQITIFIIIGIIILAVLGIFWLAKSGLVKERTTEETFPQLAPFKLFVESCLEETVKKGVYFIGTQGGYYQIDQDYPNLFYFNLMPNIYPDNSSRLEPIIIPYYFSEQGKKFPTIEKIEDELSTYIEENLPQCLGHFNIFKEQYEIISGELDASVGFKRGKTIIQINYPSRIMKDSTEVSLENFEISLNFDFLKKYKLIERVISEQENNINSVPLGYLTNLAYENDFTFETVTFADAPVIQFDFIFDEGFGESPYIYAFMVKYNWVEEEI